MRYVDIDGRKVSIVGLGTWQFGTEGWGWDSEFGPGDVQAIIDRCLELGVNLIDTAEGYAEGRSEELIGKAVQGRREHFYLATKVSPRHIDREGVIEAAAGSLRRLDTDYIDLYQVHWPNPQIAHVETMTSMHELQRRGTVTQIGVSNYSLARWNGAEEALAGPVVSNQVEYNLLQRRPEEKLLPYTRENNRFIIAYSPLAKGLLSGKYTTSDSLGGVRAGDENFSTQSLRRAALLLQALREIARRHDATPAQAALAWLLHLPNTIVIPGAKSVAQAEQNAFAADLKLSEDEWRRLDEASQAYHR